MSMINAQVDAASAFSYPDDFTIEFARRRVEALENEHGRLTLDLSDARRRLQAFEDLAKERSK